MILLFASLTEAVIALPFFRLSGCHILHTLFRFYVTKSWKPRIIYLPFHNDILKKSCLVHKMWLNCTTVTECDSSTGINTLAR